MSKAISIIALIASLAALAVSVFVLTQSGVLESKPSQTQEEVQYVLYLGTNDKDTNQPVFAPDEAKEKLKEILIDYFGGYTIQDANGGWIDGETLYQEYTLVIYLSDADLEHVHAAADRMIDVFHQSSVLIQSNQTKTDFYSGNR